MKRNGNKNKDGRNAKEKKRQKMWVHVFAFVFRLLGTGLGDPSAFFDDTEKMHHSLGEKGGKVLSRGGGEGKKHRHGFLH